MGAWLSSSDEWQPHQRAYWNDVLKLARSRNWFFKPGKNHVHGRICCQDDPKPPVDGSYCIEVIFKTGEGNPESAAMDAAKMIRACTHAGAGNRDGPPELRELEARLREAEVLLQAAERLIDSQMEFENAQILLEQALEVVGDAQAELETMAVAAEKEADRLGASARTDLLRATVDPESSAHEALDGAEQRIDEVAAAGVAELGQRIARARERAVILRTRLRAN